MLDCLILGDSIAVGTHQHAPQCSVVAKSGINSKMFNTQYSGEFFSTNVVISLGSNDHAGINTERELRSLRHRVTARARVYWIVPAIKPEVVEIVRIIAAHNGDAVLTINHLSSDGVHPTTRGYKELAHRIDR